MMCGRLLEVVRTYLKSLSGEHEERNAKISSQGSKSPDRNWS
jgi:hypothetical protein